MRWSPGHHDTIATVAFALLVVLAGCSGLLGSGGGEQTPSPTPVASNSALPPGINQTTLVDVDALLAAHAEAMAASGFAVTYEHHRTKTYPNETTVENIAVTGAIRATAGLSEYRRSVDMDRPFEETTSVWTNGTAGYKRVVGANTTYERYTASLEPDVAVHYMLENVLVAGEWNLTKATRNGTRFVLVAHGEATGGAGRDTPIVNGRMVVDAEGRIRTLNVTIHRRWYKDDVGRLRSTRTFTYEVTAVDNVSVTRPDWVAEARAAVNASTTSTS